MLSTHQAQEGGPNYSARRVRYYNGWAALGRQRINADAAADDFIFLNDLRLHDEGFIVSITDAGQSTGYAIELSRLTHQNTRTAVLKLGIINEAIGETLAYSWTDPRSERIGLNLRWIQSGLTKAAQ